jgi:tripartite-type tricarboxylate transporter receptor subunit TctC
MFRRSLLAGAAGLAASLPARLGAQGWPARPITLSVPFAAGGPTDTLARILAAQLSPILGQQVVVENVTGAAGTIGVGKVARAVPDGYTAGVGHWSTHVVNGAIYTLPYHVYDDFEPVAMVASNPQLVVSRKDLPAANLTELIAWVKANQDKVSSGTAGVGSASHIGGIYFQKLTGTSFQFIPYRGTGPAMQDLIAGQFDLMFDQVSNSLPQVRGGRVKAYAVTSPKRSPAAPDIPSVEEAGLPGFHIEVWQAVWLPKGTPREIVRRLNAALVQVLAMPEVRQRLEDLGQEIPAVEQQTPEALAAWHRREIELWWPLIKAAGIKVE